MAQNGEDSDNKSETFHEFAQLLKDLEEGRLLPSSAEISQLQSEPPTEDNRDHSPPLYSAENRLLHINRVAKLINSYQVCFISYFCSFMRQVAHSVYNSSFHVFVFLSNR